MNALLLLAVVLLVLVGAAVPGLLWLLDWAESRRAVRWSHTLARFCGDPSCGVCRSRELSAGSPRLA